MYAINATTGALTSMETLSAGTTPNSVALNPTSNFVYVTNFDSNDISRNDVSMYGINPVTGALTLLGR
jgi:DNA-binding beta-propeller fold protein YncE